MLKVGLVGVGVMGAVHLAAWQRTPAQIAGLFAVDHARAQSMGAEANVPVFDSFEALLDAVDVVDICTPTHLHHEMVLAAAVAGKHIVCEKPLALTGAEGRAMIDACNAASVMLLVAHVVRFFPQYALAKQTVERGDIGKVGVVRLTRCSFQPRRDANNWFLDAAKSGGMMLDLMIHDFDYARWVAGEVESVFAHSIRSKQPDAPVDYAHAILRHTSGALSHVEGGWAYPPPMFRTALEIAGDAGLIEHPADSSIPLHAYWHQRPGESSPDVALPSSPLLEDPYTTEIKHFYQVLTGAETTPRVTAEDGLMALRIGLAAIRSAQTGQAVRLEEIE